MSIKCPYCFESFNDNEVHFRVPIANEEDTSVFPDGIYSLEELESNIRLSDEDKLEIATKYWEANFYKAQHDQKYDHFWSQFYGGTTEQTSKNNRFPPYLRRVIEPKRDIKLLKQVSPGQAKTLDSCFRRERIRRGDIEEEFVSEIVLNDGTVCAERVCPHCHNPLPNLYGAYPVKFISIVGISGSGKTVYLSQFFKHFNNLLPNVGYTALGFTNSLTDFIKKNSIKVGENLPAGTPPLSLQQPIICEICDTDRNTYTLVMYDVAGELFGNNEERRYDPGEVRKFAEFIANSDAIMMLIDPMQFRNMWEYVKKGKELEEPDTAIRSLRGVLGNNAQTIPFAVCISKCDEIFDIMGNDLERILHSDYQGLPCEDNDRRMRTVLNAGEFNAYEERITDFVYRNNPHFDSLVASNFDSYSYFALSALGCDVEEYETETGERKSTPIGPISPKRIMDPYYWLMYRLGLLETSDALYIPNGAKCVKCERRIATKLQNPYEVEKGFIRRQRRTYTHYCPKCGIYFNPGHPDDCAE